MTAESAAVTQLSRKRHKVLAVGFYGSICLML